MLSRITYNLKATVSLLPTAFGGRENPVQSGYKPSFGFNTANHYCGQIDLLEVDTLLPGETGSVEIKLLPAKTLRKNLKEFDAFCITEGNKPVGTGYLTEVHVVDI